MTNSRSGKTGVWVHRTWKRKPGYISLEVRTPVVVIGPAERKPSKRGALDGHPLLLVREVETGLLRFVRAERVKICGPKAASKNQQPKVKP